MRLRAIGGLCNRLQAILSLRAVIGEVDVIWQATDNVSNAHFLEAFEPIQGVRFVEGPWDLERWAIDKDSPIEWEKSYRLLKPVERIATRLKTAMGAIGEYLAVHIRRTDHVPNVQDFGGGQVESDADFLRWIQGQYRIRGAQKVWLATDNGETQERIGEAIASMGLGVMIGRELKGKEEQALGNQQRNGSLEDAVIDLYMCAGAEAFKGTRYSSFSETVGRLRK